MRNEPFKSMTDAACRAEVITYLGRQLQAIYAPAVSDPLPERMQELLRRIGALDLRGARNESR